MSVARQQENPLGESSVRVAPADPRDVEEIISCHALVFPEEVIAMLGPRFLRFHHRFYATRPGGICYAAREETTHRLVGFVIGGAPELRRRFILLNAIRLLPLILWKAVTNRAVRHRVGLAFRRLLEKLSPNLPQSRRFDPPEPPAGTWSLLLYVCAHPDFRRRGVAGKLLEAFRQGSATKGFKTVRLTVLNDNAAAIRCYRKAGWTEVASNEEMAYFEAPAAEAEDQAG